MIRRVFCELLTLRMRRGVVLAALLITLGGSAGCSFYPKVPCEPYATPALGYECDDYAVVRLMYATDRNTVRTNVLTDLFGNDRSDSLKYGWCEVSIPAGHSAGCLERPLLGPPRPERDVTLLHVDQPQDATAVFEELRLRAAQSQRHEVFVFVHGYAVRFEDAACRAAQIAHDMRFDGVCALYSWPARGWLLSYLVDGVNAEWSAYYMVELLDRLASDPEIDHVHILAHSMGTRVVTKAIKDYLAQRCDRAPEERLAPPFDQLILAAADMDAQLFERDYAPYVVAASQRVTLYVSGADWALGGSQRLHLYARLGQGDIRASDKEQLKQIDRVDATSEDKGFVGHVYYGSSPRVLEDLAGVVTGTPPEQRGLRKTGESRYTFSPN